MVSIGKILARMRSPLLHIYKPFCILSRYRFSSSQAVVAGTVYPYTSSADFHFCTEEKLENDALGCLERGWICVPLVVEAYGGWGITAKETLSRIARRLAIHSHSSNSERLNAMYCRLGTVLMRQNARALLVRSASFS